MSFFILVDKRHKAGFVMAKRLKPPAELARHFLFAFGPYKTGREAMQVKKWWNTYIEGR